MQTQADGFGDVVDGGAGGAVDYDVLDLSQSGPLHRKIFTTPNQENGYVEFLDPQGNVIGTLTSGYREDHLLCRRNADRHALWAARSNAAPRRSGADARQ